MEAFALICTTCKTRLKVRDSAAIGQIMACPKCGGMVLIKPPEPGSPAAANSPPTSHTPAVVHSPVPRRSSDTGETKPDLSNPLQPMPPINTAAPLKADAFDDVDVLLGNVPARTMVPTPTVRHTPSPNSAPPPAARPDAAPTHVQAYVKPPGKKDADSQAATISQSEIPVSKQAPAKVITKPENAKPSETPQRAAAAAAIAATIPPPNATPISPLEDPGAIHAEAPAPATLAGSLARSPWQYWVMVSASGLIGILLAVGVVALTISWFSNGSKPFSPTIAKNNNPVPPANPNEAPPVAPTSVPPQEVAKNNAANVPANSTEKPVEVVTPPLPMPVAPNQPEQPKPPVPAPAQPDRDPLGLTDPPAAKPPMPLGKVPLDPLEKFADLLPGAAPPEDLKPAEKPPEPQPAPMPVEDEPNPSATNKLPKPQPRQIDIEARLSDPLPAIEINGSPLADFLQVMQGFSTVPITLRPDGLAMVRSTPYNADTPVTWKGSATTVRDAIAGALQPLGLEAKVEADQLIIDVASPQLVTAKLPVKDLTDSDEARATELAALVMAIVAPDSWSDEDGQPTLAATKDEFTVRQNRKELAQTVMLLEKLRVARGKRPQTRFEPKLFELTPRSQQAKGPFATQLTLNYSIPTPLTRVTERLSKEAKVRILFDWQSLSAVGWNPDAEVTLTVEKQTLSAALNDLTGRMDLTWRVVDANTVQILSPQTQAELVELEIYPVKELAADAAAGATLVAKIRTTLGGPTFRDAGGPGEVRFDAQGKCLILSVPQPQQLQAAVYLKSLGK